MTFDRSRIDVAFRFLVIPLLVTGLPDLPLPASAARERPVEVVLRELTISIDVGELAPIRRNGRRMLPLLERMEAQDPFRLGKLLCARIASRVSLFRHGKAGLRLTDLPASGYF